MFVSQVSCCEVLLRVCRGTVPGTAPFPPENASKKYVVPGWKAHLSARHSKLWKMQKDARLRGRPVVSKMITVQRFLFRGQFIAHNRYRIVLPENYFPVQRQICGNVHRKTLIVDTDSSLIP